MSDLADLGFKVDTKGLVKGERALDDMDKQGKKTATGMKAHTKVMAVGFLAAAAAAISLGRAALSASADLDKIAKTADGIGITTKALQQLRFAGEQSGIEINEMDKGLEFLVRSMGEASLGTGKLKDVMEAYGLSLRDGRGDIKSVDDILVELSDAYANAETSAEKALISTAAFGRSGVKMGNLMREGATGVKALTDEASNLGLVIGDEVLREAEAANDELNRLTSQIGVELKTALVEIMPIIIELAEGLLAVVEATKQAWRWFKDLIGIVDAKNPFELMGVQLHDLVARLNETEQQLQGMDWSTAEAQELYYQFQLQEEAIREVSLQMLNYGKSIKQVAAPVSKATAEVAALTEAVEDQLDAFGGAGRLIPEYKSWIEEVTETTEEEVGKMTEVWDNMIVDIQRGWGDLFGTELKAVLKDFGIEAEGVFGVILDAFIDMIAKMAAAWAAEAIFGGGIGSANGLFSGLGGGVASLFGGGATSGAVAGGAAAAGGGAIFSGTVGPAAAATSGGTGIGAGIGAAAIPAAAAAAVILIGMYKQGQNEAERLAVTQEAMTAELVGGFTTANTAFLGMSDTATSFTQNLSSASVVSEGMATNADLMTAAYKSVGIEVQRGSDGLLKMSGSVDKVRAITEAYNSEAAAGLQKQIDYQAQLNADMGDGVVRGHDMQSAIAKVTSEFAQSALEAKGLADELNAIPKDIDITITKTTISQNAEGSGGDSFAVGTGGYRTVPYDGYSPTLHAGEIFNVVPKNQANQSAQPIAQSSGNDEQVIVLLAQVVSRLGNVENAVYQTGTNNVNAQEGTQRAVEGLN